MIARTGRLDTRGQGVGVYGRCLLVSSIGMPNLPGHIDCFALEGRAGCGLGTHDSELFLGRSTHQGDIDCTGNGGSRPRTLCALRG